MTCKAVLKKLFQKRGLRPSMRPRSALTYLFELFPNAAPMIFTSSAPNPLSNAILRIVPRSVMTPSSLMIRSIARYVNRQRIGGFFADFAELPRELAKLFVAVCDRHFRSPESNRPLSARTGQAMPRRAGSAPYTRCLRPSRGCSPQQ